MSGTLIRREVFDCPVCRIAEAAIVRYVSGSPYYDDRWACTCCGDSWSGDELAERPFRRGWRQEAIERARAGWERGCTCPIERDDDLYALPCATDHLTSAS